MVGSVSPVRGFAPHIGAAWWRLGAAVGAAVGDAVGAAVGDAA